MRRSCCGWGDDHGAVQVIIDAMLAENVSVLSVTDGGHVARPRFHVFGVVEDDRQADAIRGRIVAKAEKKGMSFGE